MSLLNESGGTGNQGTGQGGTGNSGGSNQITGTTQTSTQSTQSTTTSGTPSWRDTLPEDIRGNSALASYTDVAALAKSHIHAQGLIGKKGVVVPNDKSTEEEWSGFYKQIGVPELDKYQLEVPKGKEVDEALVGKYKEVVAKAGLLPKQAQSVLEWFTNEQETEAKTLTDALDVEVKEQHAELKREWGGGYEKNLAAARAAVKEVGPQFGQYLDESGLGNDVTLIRAFAKMGSFLSEDKLRGDGSGKMGKSPADIQKEIADIRGNLKHPYFDKLHAGHKVAVAQMEELYKGLESLGG